MKLFIEPPDYLLEKIIKRIHKEERVLVLRRIIIFSITLIGSLIALMPSFKSLVFDINSSGFLSFSSLIFSDYSSVLTYWKSFTMILLETIPAVSLAIFLAILLTLVQSIKSLSKNVKTIIKLAA